MGRIPHTQASASFCRISTPSTLSPAGERIVHAHRESRLAYESQVSQSAIQTGSRLELCSALPTDLVTLLADQVWETGSCWSDRDGSVTEGGILVFHGGLAEWRELANLTSARTNQDAPLSASAGTYLLPSQGQSNHDAILSHL